MLDAAEKLRSALTGDNEATLEIDNFYEGDDLEEEVTLQELEQSIASQITQLQTFLDKTVQQLEQIEVSINIVELMGDCSRTPIF